MPIGNNNSDELDVSDKSVYTAKLENDVNRNTLPKSINEYVENKENVVTPETDPVTLRDYSTNTFVATYIDQIAKDVSSTKYKCSSKEIKKFLNNLDPRFSFDGLIEATARDMSILGDAYWGINYTNDDEIAEVIIADGSSIFKVEGEDGMIDGYVQQKKGTHSQDIIDPEDIINFKWSRQSDKHYSDSPVKHSLDVIDILEQLLMEDANNLKSGAQNGIISLDGNVSDDEMEKMLKSLTKTDSGKRHTVSAIRADATYTNINDNFKELNILDRYKTHIRTLGTQFKVSPSYVGFKDGEGGIGQGKKAQENRKNHREGVQIILNNIESKINNQLIKPEFGDDEYFEFVTESEDKTKNLEQTEKFANTVKALNDAGVPFKIEDGDIIKMDKEFNTDPAESPENEDETIATEENDEGREKPEELDECVKSVMDENPDMSESEAYAICKDQLDYSKDYKMTERKQEFVDTFDEKDEFIECVKCLENKYDKRTKAISEFKERLEGSSPNTYYNWLNEIGIE